MENGITTIFIVFSDNFYELDALLGHIKTFSNRLHKESKTTFTS